MWLGGGVVGWWGGGVVVCTVIFVSNPTTVLSVEVVSGCVVVRVVTIILCLQVKNE